MLCPLSLFACGSNEGDSGSNVLRISNCEDYIDEELLAEFEELYDCTIEYSTFGTLENLYNDIKITPDRFDLICPSDYMIEKMAKEGMLQKITFSEEGYYKTYVSPYIESTFDSITWTENGETVSLSDYAGCYMWGTLGLTFNPEYVLGEDMESWSSLWDEKYKNVSTIKDSIRDSYFMGIAYANKEQLDTLSGEYEDTLLELETAFTNGDITANEFNAGCEQALGVYQTAIRAIFNDTSEENVKRVEEGLKALKGNIYGFEVDSGKNDIASGKITINFAWSGDAVYAMDEAEGQGVELYYTVPDEGSNVWFDGWCVPASSNNVDLAVKFIEFLSDPEIVVRNMEYIGYTSGMGGQAVFDNAIDWYGVCTLEQSELTEEEYLELSEDDMEYYELCADGTVYEYVYAEDLVYGNDEDGYFADIVYFDEETESVYAEETEIYKVDLGYFFGDGEWIIYTDTIGRQFTAQYPTKDIIDRCVVMNCYDEEANGRVTLMWERVKGFTFANWVIILLSVLIVLSIAFVVCFKYREKLFKKKVATYKENKNRKKYKVVKIEKM